MTRCPYCRTELDLTEVFRDEDLRAVIELRAVFGEHGRLVWEYAELFGVTPLAKKSAKLRRILGELAKLWQAEAFEFRRTRHAISRAGIAEAIKSVVSRRFESALTNHNYLKQVMVAVAEREAKDKSRADERDLRRREESGPAGRAGSEMVPIGELMRQADPRTRALMARVLGKAEDDHD
jgi:hypothetical protein